MSPERHLAAQAAAASRQFTCCNAGHQVCVTMTVNMDTSECAQTDFGTNCTDFRGRQAHSTFGRTTEGCQLRYNVVQLSVLYGLHVGRKLLDTTPERLLLSMVCARANSAGGVSIIMMHLSISSDIVVASKQYLPL